MLSIRTVRPILDRPFGIEAWRNDEDLPVHGDQLLGQGELLLVSAGVAASGAGELSGEPIRQLRRLQIVLSGLAYLIVCVASLWFASTATLRVANRTVDDGVVAYGSVIVFGAAIVTGACCVALPKMRK
jgi:hypothetical protein